jgi:hypothetical protein
MSAPSRGEVFGRELAETGGAGRGDFLGNGDELLHEIGGDVIRRCALQNRIERFSAGGKCEARRDGINVPACAGGRG